MTAWKTASGAVLGCSALLVDTSSMQRSGTELLETACKVVDKPVL